MARAVRDLRSRPPACIVVDVYVGSFVERRFRKILSFIRSAYEVVFVGESGSWYGRRRAEPDRLAGCGLGPRGAS
jgi:hypothetical protein